MDWGALKEKIRPLAVKYRYAVVVVIAGLVLMCLPSGTDDQPRASPEPEDTAPPALSEEIADILSRMEGVGRVEVLLTEASGRETVYQTDQDGGSDETRRIETVIVTDGNRAQTGLVKSVIPPTYLGAIVVCQGADSPSVRLQVIEAVSNVTGIGTDRITVLKMK